VEISYDLSSDDARMPFVTVTVYNLAARTARRVVEHEPQGKGRRSVSWDGTTDDGDEARNGRYVVEVRAEDATGEVAACATLVLVK
jgi:flagellar hook assembly protein FlgD